MSKRYRLGRAIPPSVRTLGPFLAVVAVTIVAMVLYLELVTVLVGVRP